MSLSDVMKVFAGIEIGGTKLQIVLGDENANIFDRHRFVVNQTEGAAGIRARVEEVLRGVDKNSLAGIGVGFGGPVDRTNGKVWTSYHVSGWTGFPIKDWLTDLFAVPVNIDNDANVAALGKALYGEGKEFDQIFYMTIGSGVGSGLVVDKKIYHGDLPGETEMGHIRLDKSGRTVQDFCSGWAVDEKIRKAIDQEPDGILATLAHGMKANQARILLPAMQSGDKTAVSIFDQTMDDLAFALSHAVHFFHPPVIILGGGLTLMGEILRQRIEQNLTAYLMDAFRPGPKICLSALKEDAVPVGALAIANHPLY